MILVTTHIMSLVEEIAEEIIFLLDGQIHFQGTKEALKDRYQESNVERAIARILETPGTQGTNTCNSSAELTA